MISLIGYFGAALVGGYMGAALHRRVFLARLRARWNRAMKQGEVTVLGDDE